MMNLSRTNCNQRNIAWRPVGGNSKWLMQFRRRRCGARSKKPHPTVLKQTWCLPPKANADFVDAMEDVLSVDQRDFTDDTGLVCMDETSKQQTKETRTPLAVRPGQPAIDDFEYERNGTANLFMVCAPLEGWRQVKVTDRRTRQDFAELLKDLGDDLFSQ